MKRTYNQAEWEAIIKRSLIARLGEEEIIISHSLCNLLEGLTYSQRIQFLTSGRYEKPKRILKDKQIDTIDYPPTIIQAYYSLIEQGIIPPNFNIPEDEEDNHEFIEQNKLDAQLMEDPSLEDYIKYGKSR